MEGRLFGSVLLSLSLRLTNAGLGAISHPLSNGACTPEVCVAQRKLVQMSTFSFQCGWMLGWVHNHMVFRFFKPDFPVPSPRGGGYNPC